MSTAIYYLLEKTDCSHFHRIRADEVWHFYTGSSLCLHIFNPLKFYSCIRLGSQPEAGDVYQTVIPAGSWFAAHLLDTEEFALVGCTVAPGFEFRDFELGQQQDLIQPINSKKITAEHIYAELGEVVSNVKEARKESDNITVFKSVGNAVQDIVAASVILENAHKLNIGTEINL